MAINEISGPAPLGDYDRSQSLDVIVHSRLFPNCDPEDATLVLTDEAGRRRQTLNGKGCRSRLTLLSERFRAGSIGIDASVGCEPECWRGR